MELYIPPVLALCLSLRPHSNMTVVQICFYLDFDAAVRDGAGVLRHSTGSAGSTSSGPDSCGFLMLSEAQRGQGLTRLQLPQQSLTDPHAVHGQSRLQTHSQQAQPEQMVQEGQTHAPHMMQVWTRVGVRLRMLLWVIHGPPPPGDDSRDPLRSYLRANSPTHSLFCQFVSWAVKSLVRVFSHE